MTNRAGSHCKQLCFMTKYLSSSALVDSLKSDIVRAPGTCLDIPLTLRNSEGPFLSHVLASQCASGVAMLQKHFRLILPPPVVETASEISNCIMGKCPWQSRKSICKMCLFQLSTPKLSGIKQQLLDYAHRSSGPAVQAGRSGNACVCSGMSR